MSACSALKITITHIKLEVDKYNLEWYCHNVIDVQIEKESMKASNSELDVTKVRQHSLLRFRFFCNVNKNYGMAITLLFQS